MDEPVNSGIVRAALKGRNPSDSRPLAVDKQSAGLVMLVVFATIFFLSWAKAVLMLLVISNLISYSLVPMVNWVGELKISRSLAAGMLLSVLTLLIGYGVYSLRDQAETILDKIPRALQQVRFSMEVEGRYYARQEGVMEKVQKAAEEIEKVTKKVDGKNQEGSVEQVTTNNITDPFCNGVAFPPRVCKVLATGIVMIP